MSNTPDYPKFAFMSNKEIAAIFSLLAKLMELHGDNSFKAKAYSTAAFRISKFGKPLAETEISSLSIPGIGEAILQKIQVVLQTGELPLLQEYLDKTPPGVVDMLAIKGIGPKKIALLWHELGIESIGELAYACTENRLIALKGFGEKTQDAVLENIHFIQKNKGWFLFAELETEAENLTQQLQEKFPDYRTAVTGAFRRQLPVLDKLEWLTEISKPDLINWLKPLSFSSFQESENHLETRADHLPKLVFYFSDRKSFARLLFETTNADAFQQAFEEAFDVPETAESEEEIFSRNNLPFVAPALRENAASLALAQAQKLPQLIQPSDIRGIIHSHSQYSDGLHTLEEMAVAAKNKGYEYLVISDHSQTAVYANGLKPERIRAQHEEIDRLNAQLTPFRIFKGIESDILGDGSLDYEPGVLAAFEVVIASVHSNLKMDEEKAMQRLLRAVENPYTTILGHPTGRLLLSRPGYPVAHKKLIDACVANKVVIEINAHPRRLDLDWSWIPYALEKGALLSVDPDAHAIDGMDLVKYGVLAAQKGGLSAADNLSSRTMAELTDFLATKKS